MPEMIVARVSPAEFLEAAAVAAALDMSISQLTRESVFDRLPQWRAQAEAQQARRAALPHGVTDKMTDEAADQLVVALNRSEAIRLDLSELFSPKSKAIFRLLAFIWQEQPGAEAKKSLDRIAARIQDRLDRVHPGGVPPASNVPDKPRRDYRRRGGKS